MENQNYIQKTEPPYFTIQHHQKIIPLTISFPLKPLFFQRDIMMEEILYQKHKERIPYDYLLLFNVLPPSDYLEIPFYFYSFDQDFYSSHSEHPFYDMWYPFLTQNKTKTPWYDMGKIVENSGEIWVNASNVLLIDWMMRLSLQKVKIKKIFYQHDSQIHLIQSYYSKSITWIFVKENGI